MGWEAQVSVGAWILPSTSTPAPPGICGGGGGGYDPEEALVGGPCPTGVPSHLVPAELHIGSVSSGLQPGMAELQVL